MAWQFRCSAAFVLAWTGILSPVTSAVGEDLTGRGADRALSVRAALGSTAPEAGFDPAADLNHDGVVNVLDAALVSAPQRGAGPAPAATEQIIIDPQPVTVIGGNSGSVLFLIRTNTTPLLGYSLDVQFVPQGGAIGSVTGNVALTNFDLARNLITGGPSPCAGLHPVFSVIQDGGGGSVFVNTLTDDLSTCLAADGVNDVLAEVFFDASVDAVGTFSIELGIASALSDGNAQAVPFAFTPGEITVEMAPPIPTASQWAVVVLSLGLLILGTVLFRHRLGDLNNPARSSATRQSPER